VASVLTVRLYRQRKMVLLGRYHLLALAMPMMVYCALYLVVYVAPLADSGAILRGQALSRLASCWLATTVLVIGAGTRWDHRR
jgi:hypothetical protein